MARLLSHRSIRAVLLAVFVLLVIGPPAQAAFPGRNGKIAFASDRAGGAQADLYTMNADGSAVTRITITGALSETGPAWSPDGTKIAFTRMDPGNTNLYVMNADGSGVIPISFGRSPTWSPDGTKIAFSYGQIFVVNADGSGLTQLTNNPGDNLDPAWSPDGTKIAFVNRQPSNGDIYMMNPNGSGQTNITNSAADDESPNWSPDGTKLVLSRGGTIYTMNPDGSALTSLPAGGTNPAWSPDGTKITFEHFDCCVNYSEIYVMYADGSGQTDITNEAGQDFGPDWQRLSGSVSKADLSATLTDFPDPVYPGQDVHYSATATNAVGPDPATGVRLSLSLPGDTAFISATPTQGSCSQAAGVVTCDFGNLAISASASVDVDVQPMTPKTQISAPASVTANEGDPVGANNFASTMTTVLGVYPRPRGATPLRVSLVPAFRACTTANSTHGSPLAHPSCRSPIQLSRYLTVGTTDANGAAVNSVGWVQLKVKINPSPTPNDVLMTSDITDVRCNGGVSTCGTANAAAGPDYTGELQATAQLRITDTPASTMSDISFPMGIPCGATPDTAIGGACSIATTANAIVPGSIRTGGLAIWQLGQIQVTDGGEDGAAATTTDNTLFLKQGVFVP